MAKYIVEGYAHGKLCEFVYELFTGLGDARQKLSTNYHFVYIIDPSDFILEKHQKIWADIQGKLEGKTKNIGLLRAPIDQITVQNKTLEHVLVSIWTIYEECVVPNLADLQRTRN